jgi:hypothetical protein
MAATTTDLRMLQLKPRYDLATILMENAEAVEEWNDKLAAQPKFKYPLEAENIQRCFSFPATGCGRRAQLTLMTVDQAVGGFDEDDIEFCRLNRGWMEFSISSIILWKHLINEDGLKFLKSTNFLKLPVAIWKQGLGKWCNDIRRYNGVGLSDEKDDAILAGMFRKVVNLSGRDLQSADFEKEEKAMYASRSAKAVPIDGIGISHARWLAELSKSIDALIRLLETHIFDEIKFRTLEEWWATRRAWVPSGSSSDRHRMDEAKEQDPRIRGRDRPTKMQVIETISFEELMDAIASVPIATARTSTKPEPGFKRRALYASDDISTYIASFASADLEKVMSVGGMVVKQTPSDVINWLKADMHRSKDPEKLWLSLDYADFNKEHSKLSLALLNNKLAQMWLRRSKREKSDDIMLQKAACASWVARSHLNSWCNTQDHGLVRHYSGLWSGHRDTARDNTMLHWCYSDMMQRFVKEKMDIDCVIKYMGICGDDEDALHKDWITMAAYLGMHCVCGMNLNPSKQLADWNAHEFLQRQANKGMFPIRPLAPMIATLSTGSWYKQSHIYYDTVITSLNDNCREIIARGAKPSIMRKVVAILTSRMMTATMMGTEQMGQNRLKLEWWKYRHGSSGKDSPNSIWYGTGNAQPMPKIDESYLQVGEMMPNIATTDWLNEKSKWLVKASDTGRRLYEQHIKREAYKSFYGQYREDRREHLAVHHYGIRETEVTMDFIDSLEEKGQLPVRRDDDLEGYDKLLWKQIYESDVKRRPMTREVLFNTLGIDPQIFELMGGLKGFFELANNAEISKWVSVPSIEDVEYPPKLIWYDPALISWWKNKQIPEYD